MIFFIFLAIIALLVFVHEAGHFFMARREGVRVEEFGFGFPPRLFGFKRGETIYSINLIPLGGFVKIFGEDDNSKKESDSFAAKSVWQRSKIIIAGVVMNILLAIILLTIGFQVGLPMAFDEAGDSSLPRGARLVGPARVQITQVAPNSPAQAADLKMGDIILRMGKMETSEAPLEVKGVKETQDFINQIRGKEGRIFIQRGEEILVKIIQPRLNPPAGEGALGISLANVSRVAYPFFSAFWRAVMTVINLIQAILLALFDLIWRIFIRQPMVAQLAGPIGVFVLTEQFWRLGLIYLLQLTAVLSVNLAVLNIIPFPALDGGRLLFLFIEKIKGSPVRPETERIIHSLGFAFLITLMVLITLRDVNIFIR